MSTYYKLTNPIPLMNLANNTNDPDHIIETLTYFNTRIVSEHTEEFHEIHNNDSKIITVSIDEITKERK